MRDLADKAKFNEYLEFIRKAQKEYNENEYGEIHHIYPKCIDIEKEHANEVVKISAQNHFKAHLLLVECFKGESKQKLAYAVNMFRRGKHKTYLTSEDIQVAKEVFSESRRGKRSEETKLKISEHQRKQMSIAKNREKISATLKERWKDEKFAEEQLKVLKKPRSEQAKRNIAEGSLKRSQNEELKKKMRTIYSSSEYRKAISDGKRGKKLFTNGINKRYFFLGEEPEGYKLFSQVRK